MDQLYFHNEDVAAEPVGRLLADLPQPTGGWDRAHGDPISPAITAIPIVSGSDIRISPRQQSDSLFLNDPSRCNEGVCNTTADCLVYNTVGVAQGICCRHGRLCDPRTVCVPYSKRPATLSSLTESATVEDGTIYCGSSSPYCIALYYEYGYKLNTLMMTNCDSRDFTSAIFTNSRWEEYVAALKTTETTSESQAPTTAPSATSATPSEKPVAKAKLSNNAIIGISVGAALFVIALLLLIAFVIYRRRRKFTVVEQSYAPAPDKPFDDGTYSDFNPATHASNYSGSTVLRPSLDPPGVHRSYSTSTTVQDGSAYGSPSPALTPGDRGDGYSWVNPGFYGPKEYTPKEEAIPEGSDQEARIAELGPGRSMPNLKEGLPVSANGDAPNCDRQDENVLDASGFRPVAGQGSIGQRVRKVPTIEHF